MIPISFSTLIIDDKRRKWDFFSLFLIKSLLRFVHRDELHHYVSTCEVDEPLNSIILWNQKRIKCEKILTESQPTNEKRINIWHFVNKTKRFEWFSLFFFFSSSRRFTQYIHWFSTISCPHSINKLKGNLILTMFFSFNVRSFFSLSRIVRSNSICSNLPYHCWSPLISTK